MGKRKWVILIFAIIAIFQIMNLYNSNYKEKGTFKEIVLDDYLEKSVADDFDDVRIRVYKRIDDYEYIKNSDVDKVNELLSSFNEYELIEVDEYSVAKEVDIFDYSYVFRFHKIHTGEELGISIINGDYLMIYMTTVERKVDEKKKIIKNRTARERKFYKVLNEDIDYDYLKEFVDSIETVEVNE